MTWQLWVVAAYFALTWLVAICRIGKKDGLTPGEAVAGTILTAVMILLVLTGAHHG
jgi:hypothetical protein